MKFVFTVDFVVILHKFERVIWHITEELDAWSRSMSMTMLSTTEVYANNSLDSEQRVQFS